VTAELLIFIVIIWLPFIDSTVATCKYVSNSVSAEPLKKKKKIDISIVITREQRKMRKLEKAIRKQEMKGRTLKPVDEIEGDRSFLKTLESVIHHFICSAGFPFQCFDTVGWAAGRAAGL